MLTQLLAQAKLGAYLAVALDIGLFKVVLKAAAAADHLEQATAGMVVVLVFLEVLIQVVDALGKKSNLNFGRTGVAFVGSEFSHDFFFFHFVYPPMEFSTRITKQAVEIRTALKPLALLYHKEKNM